MIRPYDGKPGHGMTIRHPIRPRVQRQSFQRWLRVVDRLYGLFGFGFTFGICVGMGIQRVLHWWFS